MSEIIKNCDYINGFDLCCKYGGECEKHNCYFKQLQQLKKEHEELKEKHRDLAKDYAEYIETSKKIDEEVDKKLDEIKAIASNLYYHSITDPVKREAAIYKIIEIVKEK